MKCFDQFNINNTFYRCPLCKGSTNIKPIKNYALMVIIDKLIQLKPILEISDEEIKYNLDSMQKNIAKKCKSDNDHVFKYSEFKKSKCYTCGIIKLCSYCSKCGDKSLVNCYHCINSNTNYSLLKIYKINVFGCLCKKGNQDIQWIDDYSHHKCFSCNLNNFGYGEFGCLNCKMNLCFGCYNDNYERCKNKNNLPKPIKLTYYSRSTKTYLDGISKSSSIMTYNNRNLSKDFTFSIDTKVETLRKIKRNLIENEKNFLNNKNIEIGDDIKEFFIKA